MLKYMWIKHLYLFISLTFDSTGWCMKLIVAWVVRGQLHTCVSYVASILDFPHSVSRGLTSGELAHGLRVGLQ